nr:zinc finger, CCHC-type [Tanacetum cinerariifolium]
MNEAIQVSFVIDKLPPSWKDFKHTLKHNKEKLTLAELGSHLCIEESLRAHDNDKPKGNNVVGPQFYVIKLNESVSINSTIESSDGNFDENRLSSVLGPRQRSLINGTEDIDGLVVPEEATEEVVTQQPEPDLRKGNSNRTPKNFGPKFQLYLIEGTRDKVSDQHSYCFTIEDDPKTFDEAMKSQVLADLPPGCKPLGCKLIFKRKLKYHKIVDCYGINSQSNNSSDEVSTPMDTSEKSMPNNSQAVSQLEYSMVIGCLINTEDNSSTSSWVSYLVEVQSLGLPRSKLASPAQ